MKCPTSILYLPTSLHRQLLRINTREVMKHWSVDLTAFNEPTQPLFFLRNKSMSPWLNLRFFRLWINNSILNDLSLMILYRCWFGEKILRLSSALESWCWTNNWVQQMWTRGRKEFHCTRSLVKELFYFISKYLYTEINFQVDKLLCIKWCFHKFTI